VATRRGTVFERVYWVTEELFWAGNV
jgi:hypothetical protein